MERYADTFEAHLINCSAEHLRGSTKHLSTRCDSSLMPMGIDFAALETERIRIASARDALDELARERQLTFTEHSGQSA